MTPDRGFDDAEYAGRLFRAQALLHEAGLAALLLTTEPGIRYFTGFLTRFWESPTRPWFLVVPATGQPVAVIPAIGAHLMAQGPVSDIRTWRAPDPSDDGIGLLVQTLVELVPRSGRIGVPDGLETHVRMPLADFRRLERQLPGGRSLVGDQGILRRLRLIKSEAEIARIETACTIAERAFARVPGFAAPGMALSELFGKFQICCLEEGADWVPYLAGGAGAGGYADVISPATDAPLCAGDVAMLDTGLVRDGYFCDFDRNFSLGPPAPEIADAHARLIEAVIAGYEAAYPGATAADLFRAMNRVVNPAARGSDVGRLGHGLGMQLTEPPSLAVWDETVLEPGMVLTLEPGIELEQGRMMVHEENMVITADGARFLSRFDSGAMRVIG